MGEVLNISSCGVLFTTERPLTLHAEATLSVKWPVRLLNSVHLRLVVAGKIVRVGHNQAALQIQRYEFRTCSPSFFVPGTEDTVSRSSLGLQIQIANYAVQRVGV